MTIFLTMSDVGTSQGRRAWYVNCSQQRKYIANRLLAVAYGLDQSSDPYGPAENVEEVIDSVKLATAQLSNGLPGWAATPGSPSSAETKMIVNKTIDSSVHTLRHTGTQIARDAVFGKQDKELSHIGNDERPEIILIKPDSRPVHRNFNNGDKRSSITAIISPDSKDRKVSDVDIDKQIALKTPRGTASVKKKAVIDFETEDDDEVPSSCLYAGFPTSRTKDSRVYSPCRSSQNSSSYRNENFNLTYGRRPDDYDRQASKTTWSCYLYFADIGDRFCSSSLEQSIAWVS
jgi:hypothetical protein